MSGHEVGGQRRVGLLGGTFDPVHLGHLVVAEHLLVGLGLDEVRLLVAGAPWMKGQVTDAAVRVAMARAAIDGIDGLTVDDRECRREGSTFTADTLESLSADEPNTQWFFCLGSDAAANLPRWERVGRVMELATIVVVDRPGVPDQGGPAMPQNVRRMAVPALDISSSDIRARTADGRATRFLVPVSVHRQIRERGLYRDAHG